MRLMTRHYVRRLRARKRVTLCVLAALMLGGGILASAGALA